MNTDQQTNIALITGANAGIGLALTKQLLLEDWQVVALNRSDFPADDIGMRQAVRDGRLRIYKVANLADYGELRSALHAIKKKEPRIDILFNNAGGSFHELSYSKQGREQHYELMTVVPYIILMELKDLLHNGLLKTVINTSSSVIKLTKELSIESLERPKTFRKLFGPYAASKLALSLWTEAIAPRLARDDIKIRSVDPGGNNTLRTGNKSGLPLAIRLFMKLAFPPPTLGASRLYEGALGELRHESGVYLQKGRITDLKFKEQAVSVLERVDFIYNHEFLVGKASGMDQ